MPFGQGEDYGVADQQRLWQLQEGPSNGYQESTAVISLTDGDTRTALYQASQAAFHLGQNHHQWVCPEPWSYPTLMKFNNSAENIPCGGSLYLLQGLLRHLLAKQTGCTSSPLPALSMPGQ